MNINQQMRVYAIGRNGIPVYQEPRSILGMTLSEQMMDDAIYAELIAEEIERLREED